MKEAGEAGLGIEGSRALVLVLFMVLLGTVAGLAPAAVFAAGDANMASCPASTESSPGFRSYLPDCRAYELVTPPYTGGFAPSSGPQPQRSEEFLSNTLLYSALGVFAGVEGSSSSPFLSITYASQRAAGGWLTRPLTPSLAQFELANNNFQSKRVAADQTGQTTAWIARERGEAATPYGVYLREGGGLPSRRCDATSIPTEHFEAVTMLALAWGGQFGRQGGDLSRIPLGVKIPTSGEDKYLWPGDTTKANSETLYECVTSGAVPGSEPKLVGVENQEPLASNEDAELISECGTVLGGGEGHQIGAISSDGRRVIFTAQHKASGCTGKQPPTSQIYARVDGEETVPISEPSAADCAQCFQGAARETREAAVAAATLQAVYVGASGDGSRVFFLSFQELLPGITAAAGQPNLYRLDFDAPAGERLQLVSRVASGKAEMLRPATTTIEYNGVSPDGERAYFVAKGAITLSPGKCTVEDAPCNEENLLGQKPQAAKSNLYMWEAPQEAGGEARVAFVATPAGIVTPQSSPDPSGRFAVFSTVTPELTGPDDTSTATQIYEYDSQSGALRRVSVGDLGFNDNGNTGVDPASNPQPTADGRVFFHSANALTPGALYDPTNSSRNVYEWTPPSANEGARVFLIAPAAPLGESTSSLVGIDAAGENVFLRTSARLVPQQASAESVVLDARVNGGFPAPSEAGCEGESCQGSLATTAGGPAPASSSFAGAGNVRASRHRAHRRKRRHRHGSLGQRQGERQHGHKGQANTTGRTGR